MPLLREIRTKDPEETELEMIFLSRFPFDGLGSRKAPERETKREAPLPEINADPAAHPRRTRWEISDTRVNKATEIEDSVRIWSYLPSPK